MTSKTFLHCFALLIVLSFLASCRNIDSEIKNPSVKISGETMGTTYNISYVDSSATNYQKEIELLFKEFDQAVSTYNETSIISEFNRATIFQTDNSYLLTLLDISRLLAEKTDNAFDPTIMPAVRFWGFDGKERPANIDSSALNSIMRNVGLDKIKTRRETGNKLTFLDKENSKVELDLSAVAKGFGVDVIAAFLRANGIENYLIEIGGEMLARGTKLSGGKWRIAIDRPNNASQRRSEAILELDNVALATSGNYRNFYELDGRKIVHTIDPTTGYSKISDLLSVTITVKDLPNKFNSPSDAMTVHPCAFADAYATACMVMGKEKSIRFIESLPNVEGLFITTDTDGNYVSDGTSGMEFVGLSQ